MSEKQTVKFGDICREVKLTTKDPIADGFERYIGLEHLDSGSLKIKRWGVIAEDNPSFTRVFKKGHILFGKRRPYLRKAAIAEFDGICSGDIIVMEPFGSLVKGALTPFLVQSELMWDWAVKTSAGSLSPRTKFKTLSELDIPLINQSKQDSLLSILTYIERNLEVLEQNLESQEQLVEAIVNDALLCPRKVKKSSLSIGQVCKEKRIRVSPEDFGLESCYVGFEHLTPKNYWNINHSDLDGVVSQKFRFEAGDILYGKIRPYLRKSVLTQFGGICSSDLVVLKPRSKDLGIILAALFSSESFAQLSMNTAKGTKMPRADWKILEQLKIAKLSPVEVEQISSTLITCKDSYESLQHKKGALLDMKINLLKG